MSLLLKRTNGASTHAFRINANLVGKLESPVYEVFAPSYTKALKFMFTLGALVFGVLPA